MATNQAKNQKPLQRVIAYVDGFNLYYGMREARFRRFFWLDVHELVKRLLLPHQELVWTKYFTARISGGRATDTPHAFAVKEAKRKRQATYLDALETIGSIKIFEGHFLSKDMRCLRCGNVWASAEEKMTDVNIATELLVDTYANRFDTALLISGDSDLVPPVRAIREHFGYKRVIVAFPPKRQSVELKKISNGQFVISRGLLKKSQFPDSLTGRSGHTLTRPVEWKTAPI